MRRTGLVLAAALLPLLLAACDGFVLNIFLFEIGGDLDRGLSGAAYHGTIFSEERGQDLFVISFDTSEDARGEEMHLVAFDAAELAVGVYDVVTYDPDAEYSSDLAIPIGQCAYLDGRLYYSTGGRVEITSIDENGGIEGTIEITMEAETDGVYGGDPQSITVSGGFGARAGDVTLPGDKF